MPMTPPTVNTAPVPISAADERGVSGHGSKKQDVTAWDAPTPTITRPPTNETTERASPTLGPTFGARFERLDWGADVY